MNTYIAFLRAINVTNRFVKMEVLRSHFATLGFDNVQTYIQSGNVVFSTRNDNTAKLEAQIEAHLATTLGFDVPTMVRSSQEMIAIASYDPFPQAKSLANASSYVSLLKEAPGAEAQQKMVAMSDAIDTFHVNGRQLYWLYNREQGESKMTNAKVEKILKTAATRRNTNTIHKIAKKYF